MDDHRGRAMQHIITATFPMLQDFTASRMAAVGILGSGNVEWNPQLL
jgi:hypothetical protein